MKTFIVEYFINGQDFTIEIEAESEQQALEFAYETFDGFTIKKD